MKYRARYVSMVKSKKKLLTILFFALAWVYADQAEEVPILSLSSILQAKDEARARELEQIASASRLWGFFHIVDHGIDKALIDDVRNQAREFFSAPTELKYAVKRTHDNVYGFYDDEFTKNVLDWKQGFDFGSEGHNLIDGTNKWPSDMPLFKDTMTRYYTALENLSSQLMAVIAESLGLDFNVFKTAFTPHTAFLRLNYYPPCPDPDGHLAVNRHTDAGALTVLLQDDGIVSLQVNKDGQWVDVKPVQDAFTINIGDMLQVWTNDYYRAPEHRVKSKLNVTRLSAPFFYNPSYAVNVEPLILGDYDAPAYETINWGEFRRKRFEGDYADVGVEVQIEHYRRKKESHGSLTDSSRFAHSSEL